HAAGVSFAGSDGKQIPLAGFAQLTLVFSVVGILLARSIGRRASQPRSTFVRVTAALTALSVLPDLAVSFTVAGKLTLILTHAVAASIVIPVLAQRLENQR